MSNSLETSVLICAKDSERNIEKVLKEIKDQSPKEIILIDGCSKDNTLKIASLYTDKIYSDMGKGLGYARKLGVSKVKTKYLIIISPDDSICKNFISIATKEIKESKENTVALLAPKRLENIKTLCDYGQNEIYKMVQKFQVRTVGNPSIYKTFFLKEYQYDENFSANEDTDLCERWHLNGLKTGWGKNFHVLENESKTWQQFKQRYIWYGEGDYNFFIKWKSININTAIRHLLHPLITYGLKYSFFFLLQLKFKAVIFSLFCCIYRYKGFLNKNS